MPLTVNDNGRLELVRQRDPHTKTLAIECATINYNDLTNIIDALAQSQGLTRLSINRRKDVLPSTIPIIRELITEFAQFLSNNLALTSFSMARRLMPRDIKYSRDLIDALNQNATHPYPRIVDIDFSYINIGQLARLNMERFQRIKLVGNTLDDATADKISTALASPNCQLRWLDLCGMNMTDDMLTVIAIGLMNNTTLTTLALNGEEEDAADTYRNFITAQGVRYLVDALKRHPSMVVLKLGGNFIGDEGANLIAQLIDISESLRELQVDISGMTNAGIAKILEAVKYSKTLTHLDFCNRELEDGMEISAIEMLEINNTLVDFRVQYFSQRNRVNQLLSRNQLMAVTLALDAQERNYENVAAALDLGISPCSTEVLIDGQNLLEYAQAHDNRLQFLLMASRYYASLATLTDLKHNIVPQPFNPAVAPQVAIPGHVGNAPNPVRPLLALPVVRPANIPAGLVARPTHMSGTEIERPLPGVRITKDPFPQIGSRNQQLGGIRPHIPLPPSGQVFGQASARADSGFYSSQLHTIKTETGSESSAPRQPGQSQRGIKREPDGSFSTSHGSKFLRQQLQSSNGVNTNTRDSIKLQSPTQPQWKPGVQ